jgi:hypothetical protein
VTAYSLKARKPYLVAERVLRAFNEYDDIALMPDWDIYWLAGISSLRAIWHCLKEEDSKISASTSKNYKDFDRVGWGSKTNLLYDFVRTERDRAIKSWSSDVRLNRVHSYVLINGVKTPSNYRHELVWQDDEDALRLFELALDRWHQFLCVFEQALLEDKGNAFQTLSEMESVLSRSNYFETAPTLFRV